MFLGNCWYVAAWSHEVGREPPVDIDVDAPALTFKRMHEEALERETGARSAA